MVKISIIVPAYNVEKYLSTCLESLIYQTLQEIEIIVINDGSTDKTRVICDDFSVRDRRIKVIHQENGGVSSARNRGIDASCGDFLMFVDSDDWIDTTTCEKVYNIASENDVDSVIFCSISEYGNSSVKKDVFNESKIVFDKKLVYNQLFKGIIGLEKYKLSNPERIDRLIPNWGKMYSSSIIKQNSIKFIDLGKIPSECQLFNMEYYFHSENTIYIKEYFYHYRRDNYTSLTKATNQGLFKKWLNWARYVDDFATDKGVKKDVEQVYYNRICFSIIPLGLNCVQRESYSCARNELKSILFNELYIDAFKKFEFKYLPLPWKVYFGFAKFKFITGFYLMCKLMRYLIKIRMK